VFDHALYGDELRETVDDLNESVQRQLVMLQEDSFYRGQFGYLNLIQKLRSTGSDTSGLDSYYRETRAFDEMLTDESYGRLLVAYAVREAAYPGYSWYKDASELLPRRKTALERMDQFAVFKTFVYGGGFGDDNVGVLLNDFVGASIPSGLSVARAVRSSIAHLPEDKAKVAIEEAAKSYGRTVELWTPFLDATHSAGRAAGVAATLRYMREGLAGSGYSPADGQRLGSLSPLSSRYRELMTAALSEYAGEVEWGAVERYGLYDDEGLREFEETVHSMSAIMAENKRVPKKDAENVTVELGALIHGTLRATGTEYGKVLSEQLEGAKQPLSNIGTEVKVLPFAAITQLANKMLGALQQSPVFADKTIKPLNHSALQDLPEAFRRLMFIASHGSEGDDLPVELEVHRRMDAVDKCVDVLMAALGNKTSPQKEQAAKRVGTVAVASRGNLPDTANVWRKWQRGFGYLT
jgi:hypothetical protein